MSVKYFCECSPEHDTLIMYGQSTSDTPPEPSILARYIGGGWFVTDGLYLREVQAGSYWKPLSNDFLFIKAQIKK